jgi:hypothetical protein
MNRSLTATVATEASRGCHSLPIHHNPNTAASTNHHPHPHCIHAQQLSPVLHTHVNTLGYEISNRGYMSSTRCPMHRSLTTSAETQASHRASPVCSLTPKHHSLPNYKTSKHQLQRKKTIMLTTRMLSSPIIILIRIACMRSSSHPS